MYIRQNQIHNMELVLLYDDSLNNYDDKFMRKSLKQSYNQYYYDIMSKNNQLPYEFEGYNCITNTLKTNLNYASLPREAILCYIIWY